ncbi:hypothetical protein F5888DRAFT_1630839 [Russula emetica]|nr:hypothetical protein F5888DRAFT_1630839 [Russula emetica]
MSMIHLLCISFLSSTSSDDGALPLIQYGGYKGWQQEPEGTKWHQIGLQIGPFTSDQWQNWQPPCTLGPQLSRRIKLNFFIVEPQQDTPFISPLTHYQVCSTTVQVNQGNNQLGYALRREIQGPTQAAAVPSADHKPPLGPPTAEYLRQLANRYMHHPGSQVDAVCMERISAGRYKVTIALEVTDLL